ncbi:MAG: O-antigen ligase family protein, partial [Candidatus Levybacteria bacterium]|nr:O-antigen ligase family protein [Candidatus Levybacteria bacterium]
MQSSKLRNYFKKEVPSLLTFNFEHLTYYLILLFLPTQFGRHFWPKFSFVNGARIDYLSPTLYFTDVLIILLFIFSVFPVIPNSLASLRSGFRDLNLVKMLKPFGLAPESTLGAQGGRVWHDKKKIGSWIAIMALLTIGITFAKSPLAGLYGLVKLLEFIFFGFYTAKIVKNIYSEKKENSLLLPFVAGILFESVLAIWQYLQQGSIGGLLYFLGERSFNSQTPGIANASINGSLILRPYGTFPHPNVLAGYLIIAMVIISSNFKYQNSKFQKVLILICTVIGTAALFLTMSRVAIALWLLIISYRAMLIIYKRIKDAKLLILYSSFVILSVGIIFISPLRFRFLNFNFSDESIVVRKDLTTISLEMIKNNPVIGLGINNFLVNLPAYEKIKENAFFVSFQPVHNIFLL